MLDSVIVNGFINRYVIKYKGILLNFNMYKWYYF